MNDLPAIRTNSDTNTATLDLPAWDNLIARLTLAEARLAAHHHERYDTSCLVCHDIEEL